MKRIFTLLLILCLALPILSDAEEFSIRNGIKWGMSSEQVNKLMIEEGYKLATSEMSNLGRYLIYKGVNVAGIDCNMLLIFFDSDEIPKKLYGLQWIIYYRPSYSMLKAHNMLTDYNTFFDVLTKKYSKPKKNLKWWTNEDFDGVYSKETGAKMGLYRQRSVWEKKDVIIELAISDDLKSMLIIDISEPTVYAMYASKEYQKYMASLESKDDGGM